MLFDSFDEEMQFAGDALLSTPDVAPDAFDTSNLAGDLGMQVGGELASATVRDPGVDRVIDYRNDGDPSVYIEGRRNVHTGEPLFRKKLGEIEGLENPVPDSPGGRFLRHLGNAVRGAPKEWNELHMQDRIPRVEGEHRFYSDESTNAATRTLLKTRADEAKRRDGLHLQRMLGVTLNR